MGLTKGETRSSHYSSHGRPQIRGTFMLAFGGVRTTLAALSTLHWQPQAATLWLLLRVENIWAIVMPLNRPYSSTLYNPLYNTLYGVQTIAHIRVVADMAEFRERLSPPVASGCFRVDGLRFGV